jgi:hypothetical protein
MKEELINELVDIINKCSEEAKVVEVFSREWTWIASRKTLAEQLLIKFND